MEAKLYFLRKECPECGGEYVVALYEQCWSEPKKMEYTGAVGKICLRCGWYQELNGQPFGFYTGKYCDSYTVNLDHGGDPDAVRIVRQMLKCDGDWDASSSLAQYASRRRESRAVQARREREAQALRERQAQERREREEQARREREEQARREREEQARREREEQARREREEQARREREEQARREREERYAWYMAEGRRQLGAGRLQEALSAFYIARNERNTYDTMLGIAEALARSANADAHADAIIQELEGFRAKFERQMTPDHFLWLARAYAAKGRKDDACACFFRAGDIYYAGNDFVNANACYQESVSKVNLYHFRHEFQCAFAYYKANDPLDADGHRLCANYYEKAIEQNNADDQTYRNLAFHLNALEDYERIDTLLTPRLLHGSADTSLLSILADACFHLERWTAAANWYEALSRCGGGNNAYRVGKCRAMLRQYDRALQELRKFAGETGQPEYSAYEWLAQFACRCGDRRAEAEHLLKAMALREDWNRAVCEAWLEKAERYGFSDIAEQMLELLPAVKEQREAEARSARYQAYIAEGKRRIAAGDFAAAYAALCDARGLDDTAEVRALLADVLAASGEAASRPGEVVELFSGLAALNEERRLLLARALVQMGDAARACAEFFRAGDVFFSRMDYPAAYACYREAIDKTGRPCQDGCEAHLAWAYFKTHDPMSAADHRYCIDLYTQYRKRQERLGDAVNPAVLTNLGYHHNALKEYRKTAELLTGVAEAGCDRANLLSNLANACFALRDWAKAERWYLRASECGGALDRYRVAVARAHQGRYAEALDGMIRYAGENQVPADRLCVSVADIAAEAGDRSAAARCRLKALELADDATRRKIGEAFLLDAEDAQLEEIAAQMLALLPEVRNRRAEEARRREQEARRRRDDAMILLMT